MKKKLMLVLSCALVFSLMLASTASADIPRKTSSVVFQGVLTKAIGYAQGDTGVAASEFALYADYIAARVRIGFYDSDDEYRTWYSLWAEGYDLNGISAGKSSGGYTVVACRTYHEVDYLGYEWIRTMDYPEGGPWSIIS